MKKKAQRLKSDPFLIWLYPGEKDAIKKTARKANFESASAWARQLIRQHCGLPLNPEPPVKTKTKGRK